MKSQCFESTARKRENLSSNGIDIAIALTFADSTKVSACRQRAAIVDIDTQASALNAAVRRAPSGLRTAVPMSCARCPGI